MSRVIQAGRYKVVTTVYIRSGSSLSSAKLGVLYKGAVIDLAGWVDDGDSINGNRKWFFDAEGNYFWSGAFTSIAGTPAPAEPVPAVVPVQVPVSPEPVTPITPAEPCPVDPADIPGNTLTFDFTPEAVKQMVPGAQLSDIRSNLPIILSALKVFDLDYNNMILMAIATVATETGAFKPINEFPSKYNTSPGGRSFDLYDHRKDLGNLGSPDGERFKGRGYVQLTGRSNYTFYSHILGLGNKLVDDPDQANVPETAAQLLAAFLKRNEVVINNALKKNDLHAARRAVNGGLHGIDTFVRVYNRGLVLIAANKK